MRVALLALLAIAAVAHGRELLEESKILGGRIERAPRGRFPYIAQLRYPFDDPYGPGKGVFSCTGILIRPDIVLTTAFCAVDSALLPDIRLNAYELQNGTFESARVMATAWPRTWAPGRNTVYDNIAVMKLERPVRTRPVRTPPANPLRPVADGTKLGIAGWGFVERQSMEWPNAMRGGSLLLLSAANCDRKWQTDPFNMDSPGWYENKFICAGFPGHIKALCGGDLGSPLIVRGANADGDLVIGVGSTTDCRAPGQLGGSVFTNLAYYHHWITRGIHLLRTNATSTRAFSIARRGDLTPRPDCGALLTTCMDNSECCSNVCFRNYCYP